MTRSHGDHATGAPEPDPFATKGGAVFVETLASMVMPSASKSVLDAAVARGRARHVAHAGEDGEARAS